VIDHWPGWRLLQRRHWTNRGTGWDFAVHAEPSDETLIPVLNHGVSLGGKTIFEKVGTAGWQVIAFLAGLIAGSTSDATCHVEQEALLDDGHRGVLQIASAPP
jgi:hypothetical protein